MLKALQIAFLLLLGIAVAAFSAWQYFRGGDWWVAALGALVAYAALLSGIFLGSPDAWHRKAVRYVFDFALSTKPRAILSLALLLSATTALCVLAYRARPAATGYFEVRVYNHADLPGKYLVGTNVILHTRTDGLTHQETVGKDGGALFWSVPVPTTLFYQVEVEDAKPPFMFGGSHTVDRLPDRLALDASAIPPDSRLPLPLGATEPAKKAPPRPPTYLANVEERGDQSLQRDNAPWGVPQADFIINRLGYVLGYDFKRRMARWVAYSIGPTDQVIPRTQGFVSDPAISRDRQASLSDYKRSGYDRGHLISPADLYFKGPVTVAEAYYMSTVAPQTPWLNRHLWAQLERIVRSKVQAQQRPAFIVAGPLFIAPSHDPNFKFRTIGNGRIPVPTHFFRIVAMEARNGRVEAFGVIAPNASEEKAELPKYLVSIREIEEKSGLSFFPLLDPQVAERIKTQVGEIWN